MELLVLDQTLKVVSTVDTFESLIWTDRYCAHGDFELYMMVDLISLSILTPNVYLYLKESDHVMIIEDRKIETDVETGSHLVITGRSLESILDRRIIWAQTILTGNFQSAIQKLLNENVVSPTITNRAVSNFIFEASTDPIITALTIEAQFHGENLYEVIQRLCSEKNIGFRVTLTADNKFKFKLYSGVDRSYSQTANPWVIFSPEFENILNSSYLESIKPLKTVTLVAGEGEGAARKTIAAEISGGGGSGLSRREMFTDAGDISSTIDGGTLPTEQYNAQMSQRGQETLGENIMIQSFDGQVEATQMFKYGEDFFMGDILQIVNEFGMEAKTRVIELIRSQSLSGFVVYPTFAAVD